MKNIGIMRRVFRETGFNKFALSFLVFFLLVSAVISLLEPEHITYFDTLWFCFSAVTTIGFGDIVVTLAISKILTILLSIYGITLVAVFTGTIANVFSEMIRLRSREGLSGFMDKLEVLPTLSQEELAELSEKIKNMRAKKPQKAAK